MLQNPSRISQTPLKKALARWESDGGATCAQPPAEALSDIQNPSGVEYQHLHSRVIALENIVIALLAEADDRQIELVREMAAHIAPREGAVQHILTLHAATQMTHMVDRSAHFRTLFTS